MNRLGELTNISNALSGISDRRATQASSAMDLQFQEELRAAPAGADTRAASARVVAAKGQAEAARRTELTQQKAAAAGEIIQRGREEDMAEIQQRANSQMLAQHEDKLRAMEQQQVMFQESKKEITRLDIEASNRLQSYGIIQDNRLQLASRSMRADLARIGGDVRAKILDSRLRFMEDEQGRKFTSERQLADLATVISKDQYELKSKLAEMQQASKNKIMMMELAANKLNAALERGYLERKGDLDRASQLKISNLVAEMERQARNEQAKASNTVAMFQAAGTIGGAVLGSVVGPGAGTAAGAVLGATVGGAVGVAASSMFS